jgi:RhtB (resistance to homoserine/threonine) family protein
MMEFITITFIGLLMIISPGPDFAMVTKISLSDGRLAAIMASVGVALANLCHVGINILGIGVIISQSVIAFTIMKVLGAAYLLYLGIKGLKAKPQYQVEKIIPEFQAVPKRGCATDKSHLAKRGFLTGVLTSLLNPKACLFYLSFFSVIISPDTVLSLQIFYGFWLSFLALVWFIMVSFFFTNPSISAKISQGKHWIERFAGGALIFLGIRLLGSEASL